MSHLSYTNVSRRPLYETTGPQVTETGPGWMPGAPVTHYCFLVVVHFYNATV